MAWELVREFSVGLSENKISKIRYNGFGNQLNFTFIEVLDRDHERNSATILTNANFNEYRYKVTIRNYNLHEFVYQYDSMPSGTIQISPYLSRTIKIIVERELKNAQPDTSWERVFQIINGYTSHMIDKERYRYRLYNTNNVGSYGINIKQEQQHVTTVSVPQSGYYDLTDYFAIRPSGEYSFSNSTYAGFNFVYLERQLKNAAPTTTSFTKPTSGTTLRSGNVIDVQWNPSTDSDGDLITYALEVSINNANYQVIRNYGSSREFTYTVPMDADTVRFRVISRDSKGATSDYGYSETFTVIKNTSPTLTLNTGDNVALNEGNAFTINGQATDADAGNVISVKYRINSEASKTIDAKVSNGTPLAFSKSLTYKQGKLYEGNTAITGELAEGATHTLTVWSEDDQGGKSANAVRSFTVIPNKPPTLVINSQSTKSNLINKETVTISGSTGDPENKTVSIVYRLNGGNAVEIHNGAPGNWSFTLQLKNLQTGVNTVAIEVTDNFGAKANKTLRVTKTHNGTPLKNATAMWRLNLPTGTAKEVLAWVNRELGDLNINAKISMGAIGAKENFTAMNLTNSAPVDEVITEDEYSYMAGSAQEYIVIKLDLSRNSTTSDQAVKLISGVLD